eukprot:3664172-Prymnesium_polylepis.1
MSWWDPRIHSFYPCQRRAYVHTYDRERHECGRAALSSPTWFALGEATHMELASERRCDRSAPAARSASPADSSRHATAAWRASRRRAPGYPTES